MPNFPPPLSFEELREIAERNRYSKDVKKLLWEIKRLHAIVSFADQFARTEGAVPPAVWEALRLRIKDDPVVKRRQELDKPRANPVDDWPD